MMNAAVACDYNSALLRFRRGTWRVKSIRKTDTNAPHYSRDGRITERALKAAADVMEVAGILKKRPTLADVATNDFLPK